MSATAKLFSNGGSQAVRLPKEFRFEGDEVAVRRLGLGILLEPLGAKRWPRGYWSNMPRLRQREWQRPQDLVPPPIEDDRNLP